MNSLALIIEARFIGYGKNSILAGNTKFRWPLEGGVGVRSPRGGGGRGGGGRGGRGAISEMVPPTCVWLRQ